MVENKTLGIEKILQVSVYSLVIVILIVSGLLVKSVFFASNSAPRTSVEKQIADAKQILEKNPNDLSAHLMLGYTYSQTGEYSKAEQEFLNVLAADKKNTKAYYLLALNYEKQGNISKALETFVKIEDYEPALYALGRLYYIKEDYKKSVTYLKKALAKQETSSDTLFYLGLAYEKLGDKKEAAKNFKEAIKYTPDLELAKKALKRVSQ